MKFSIWFWKKVKKLSIDWLILLIIAKNHRAVRRRETHTWKPVFGRLDSGMARDQFIFIKFYDIAIKIQSKFEHRSIRLIINQIKLHLFLVKLKLFVLNVRSGKIPSSHLWLFLSIEIHKIRLASDHSPVFELWSILLITHRTKLLLLSAQTCGNQYGQPLAPSSCFRWTASLVTHI